VLFDICLLFQDLKKGGKHVILSRHCIDGATLAEKWREPDCFFFTPLEQR
jgi:hypothetical protein